MSTNTKRRAIGGCHLDTTVQLSTVSSGTLIISPYGWELLRYRTDVDQHEETAASNLPQWSLIENKGAGIRLNFNSKPARREEGLSPWEAIQRSTKFWTEAVAIYGSYKVCQLRCLHTPKEEVERIWECQHKDAAIKIHKLCCDLRGFYLKTGQFLAKPDLVPDAWVHELSRLHDQAPQTPLPIVRDILETEFKRPMADMFERFDEQPVGSASIAQVHRARLRGASHDVAVKIQHPAAERLMLHDLRNQKVLGRFLQKFELGFDLMSVFHELEMQLHQEFDFTLEAQSMDEVAAALRAHLGPKKKKKKKSNKAPSATGNVVTRTGATARAPLAAASLGAPERLSRDAGGSAAVNSGSAATLAAVTSVATQDQLRGGTRAVAGEEDDVWDDWPGEAGPVLVPRSKKGMVTRKALVMDFVEGTPINNLAKEMQKRGVNPDGFLARSYKLKILTNLALAYGHMIVSEGFFQADPHPGNLFVCKDGKVAVLDFGQTKRLPRAKQLAFARLVLALCEDDRDNMVRITSQLGLEMEKPPVTPSQLKYYAQMLHNMFNTRSPPTASGKLEAFGGGEASLKHNAVKKFPSDMFFVLRACQLLRGISHGMRLEWAVIDTWRPIAEQTLLRHSREEDMLTSSHDHHSAKASHGILPGLGSGAIYSHGSGTSIRPQVNDAMAKYVRGEHHVGKPTACWHAPSNKNKQYCERKASGL
eukprot:jgi/Mesvir1/6733/Mv04438-RA.1